MVWQNFSNLAKIRCSSKFSVQFCDQSCSGCGFPPPERRSPPITAPKSTIRYPGIHAQKPRKSNQKLERNQHKTFLHKIRVLPSVQHTHLALALRLPSHTPAASSFLTALVVVYTPIMLGSAAAFTALHAHKHTSHFCFNPPQTTGWVVAEIAKTAFVITLQQQLSQARTPTLTH